MNLLDVFVIVFIVTWPAILLAPLGGLAVRKKWFAYDKLSLISGGAGILIGFYYSLLFGGGLDTWVDGWPIWLVCVIACGFSCWYLMKIVLGNIQLRESEKEKQGDGS